MKKLLLLLIIPFLSFGQNSQIVIDGKFDDWENINSINDPIDGINGVDEIDFTNMAITNDNGGANFIRDIISDDIRSNKWNGQVITRFPPEPNGHLHIGHAKSLCINFGIASETGGRCHLRFDDTNPSREEHAYVESIKQDVRWLGWDWGTHLYFASDYFDTLYAESAESIRIMALAMHPYLSGSAHRIRYVRETFEHILAQPGVVCWDGEPILDWYLQQRPLPA